MKIIKNYISKQRYNIGLIAIIGVSVLLGVFVFSGAYKDLWEACKLSWRYIVYLFGNIGEGVEGLQPPTLPTPPAGGGTAPPVIPNDPAIFLANLRIYGLMFITGNTYSMFMSELMYILLRTATITLIVLPILFILKKLIYMFYFRQNNKHGKITMPLRVYLFATKITVLPTVNYIKGLIQAFKDSKVIKAILAIIWVLNLNILSIILPFIPFYLYFCITLDLVSVYNQIKFTIFSLKYIGLLSLFIIIPIAILLIDKWRQKHAVNRLNTFEARNEELLKGRDISTYKHGTMGTRKTMTLTDEALTLSVMQTKKAEELKSLCRKKFPNFNWLLFEFDIEAKIKDRTIINWATCRRYVADLELQQEMGLYNLYGYDTKRYKTVHYDGVTVEPLFKVLDDYSRLHFLYICSGSFIISNYAIREDKQMYTLGNTVKWDCDFFKFDRDYKEASYYSRILNFDILRMGKKLTDWVGNDSLEFGVICITEDDKEQLNSVETQGDSTESPYPTPKNDGMSRTEKYIRHRATVMGHCFISILKDGQRVMSINADTRELATLELMLKPSKEKNTLPFFFFEKALYKISAKLFDNFDDEFCFKRGDEALVHYLIKQLNSFLCNFYYRRKNRYGYVIISKELEAGTLKGKPTIQKQYQCNAKIYSDRYNTATHESYFNDRARASGVGINDYKSYRSTTMTDEEFNAQNSYSRLYMTNPNWKQPFIDKANEEKALKKAAEKVKADELKERLKKEKLKGD